MLNFNDQNENEGYLDEDYYDWLSDEEAQLEYQAWQEEAFGLDALKEEEEERFYLENEKYLKENKEEGNGEDW